MDTPKKWTIYCHTHIESGRRYIGLTSKTMMARWNGHVDLAKRSNGNRSHFAAAIRKYGRDAFSHQVLEICSSLEEANLSEEAWIESFSTRDSEFGFNLTKGGAHTPHPVKNPWDRPGFREKQMTASRIARQDPAVKIRLSQAAKKLWQDPVYRDKVITQNLISHSAPEYRSRTSAQQKAIKSDPHVKARASAVSKAMWSSENYRVKNAELWKNPEFRAVCQSGLIQGAATNSAKTHCPRGHEYTPENTYLSGKYGSRVCRTCTREQGKLNMRAKRARDKLSSS